MSDKFENQKEALISIKHEISLLYQQINYLLRNEKPLELLDLDVLMNRTHTLYDLLCAINLGENPDDEELDINPEALAGLFGGTTEEETEQEETILEETPVAEEPEPKPLEESEPEIEPMEESEPEIEPEEVPEPEIEPEEVPEPEPIIEEPTEQPKEEPKEEQQPETVPSDEYGFFFRFEDTPPVEEPTPEPTIDTPFEPVESQPDEPIVTDDGKVVHFVQEVAEEDIPARDLVDNETLVRDNPFDMPRMDDETDDGMGFELSETLGESLMREDHSLAAKLQQNPVRDLKSVIGINDKFLFVNELFGGSMEKYNKSIENLNDLKTLNGAMIYLNELKIELQWNSSNEAYQKLAELVRRKFE